MRVEAQHRGGGRTKRGPLDREWWPNQARQGAHRRGEAQSPSPVFPCSPFTRHSLAKHTVTGSMPRTSAACSLLPSTRASSQA